MKKFLVGAALGLGVLAGPSMAQAVEFNASGEWLFGFGAVEASFSDDNNGDADTFNAQQRIRLYLDAVVSETLSGTVGFTIGETAWGVAGSGGALGTDGTTVNVRDAYIDWFIPSTQLQIRMGLQGLAAPNAAGGAAIIDEQVAAIVASYQASETVGVTAFWARPANDNWVKPMNGVGNPVDDRNDSDGYLDNIDLFGIAIPINANGIEATPWGMIGFIGRNSIGNDGNGDSYGAPGNIYSPFVPGAADGAKNTTKPYGTLYYFGLPVVFGGAAPFNVEFDLNYGFAESMGKTDRVSSKDGLNRRADSRRQGWLIKALFEYEMDWGTPGLFAWYGSGDDGNVKNGSERLPSISPSSNFTSFMQDGDTGWTVGSGFDLMLEFGGTWAIGLQAKDLSFVEDLKHVVRATYWAGTNSTSMIQYFGGDANTAFDPDTTGSGVYLTTADYLIEFNLDSTYAIYDNLSAIFELGYIVNGIDRGQWKKGSNTKGAPVLGSEDAWKVALVMKYEF